MKFDLTVFSYDGIVLITAVTLALILLYRLCRASRYAVLPLLFRALTIFALVAALFRPYIEKIEKTSNVALLVDISDSMNELVAQEMLIAAQDLANQGLQIKVLPFAGQAAVSPEILSAAELGAGVDYQNLRQSWGKLNLGATNLAQALQVATSESGTSVLLLSDAQVTSGNLDQSLEHLIKNSSKVFPLLPTTSNDGSLGQFRISQLYAPLLAPAQKSVDLKTSIINKTAIKQRGRLEVKHDSKTVFNSLVEVEAGKEKLFTTQSDSASEGIKEIKAIFTPDDSSLEPSAETILISGQAREKVLLLSGSLEDQRYLKETLEKQAYQLVAQGAASKISAVPELADFSAVILNNLGVDQAPKSLTELAEQYVRDGGGLIMIGGNRSFGLGGYRGTALEKALPVTLLPPETTKKRLNVAVELVMDKSRSMADGERLEFAKAAAIETIKNLKDDDFVGVIGFDASPFVVIDLTQVVNVRSKATERVGRLFSAGRTNLLPAIDEARRSLVKVNAGRKHMIVLTDGKIPDEGPYYIELTKEMRLRGITLSTVLIGSDSDPGMLKTMANQGGGAFYQTSDPRNLPKIFLQDIKVNTGEMTLKEDTDYLVRSGPGTLVSTSISNFPPLRGYVQTAPKDGANLELVAFGFAKAEPLLASWSYHKGKAIAYTSDASGRWSNSWVSWSRYATFWSELLESVRQKRDLNETIRFDLRYSLEKGVLVLDLSVYADQAPSVVTATLQLPSGVVKNLDFVTISPGHYQVKVEEITAGRFDFRAKLDNNKLTPVAFILPGTLFGERRDLGFNKPLLYELASKTKGKINPTIQDLKEQVYEKKSRRALWQWFVCLAVFFFLLEVYARELEFKVKGK